MQQIQSDTVRSVITKLSKKRYTDFKKSTIANMSDSLEQCDSTDSRVLHIVLLLEKKARDIFTNVDGQKLQQLVQTLREQRGIPSDELVVALQALKFDGVFFHDFLRKLVAAKARYG